MGAGVGFGVIFDEVTERVLELGEVVELGVHVGVGGDAAADGRIAQGQRPRPFSFLPLEGIY